MPFADEYADIWEIAIQEACRNSEMVCERISDEAFTGDILEEIKVRVCASDGLLAVLDGANPNVFLEIGYAWGLGKPTILVANTASALPFDIRGQRCIIYKNISDLRKRLAEELTRLKASGVFGVKAR